MSQWQEIQKLESRHRERVLCLYSDDKLPMEVRVHLAYWIEEQNWRQAVQPDYSQAYCLFHTMLALLDDQLGRLVLGADKNMLLKHNLRRSKLHLQAKYQDKPEQLASIIHALLIEEQAILSEALATSQAMVETPCDTLAVTSHQHNIEGRLMEMRRTIQGLKCSVDRLEDLQDTFDFCLKTQQILEPAMPATDPVVSKRRQELQTMLNNVDRCRKKLLAQIQELLGRSDTLRELLLAELAAWQDRQHRVCIGASYNTSLVELEKWFTGSAEELFHLLRLLQTLEDMRQKVSYEQEPLAVLLPQLQKRLQEQIFCLLKSAFVVEIQPYMPLPNHRRLVLKTSNKFSVRARLLVKLLDRNHPSEVKIEIDKSTNLGGFRRFNILPSTTKTMVMDRPQVEGLICDFKYIMLKEQKSSGSGKGKGGKGLTEGSLPVTEELHIITFTLDYCYQGLKFQLQTSTLPVVVISNVNQMSSAWASILWFIMLSSNPTNQLFFSSPPAATWDQLSPVLSWQFSFATERGLNTEQLKMLREKLCGPDATSQSTITWDQFAKDIPPNFSFWTWIDGILLLIKEHLLQLWKNDLIMGFVSRKREKRLLKKMRAGTFLLRFSESIPNGGITCTWVDYNDEGSPKFRSVEPYTNVDLKSLALPDIIRDYQLLAEEDIPENPLRYLYPDTPRDEAFCLYYSERREENLEEKRQYLNRRLIRVSSRQPEEAQGPELNGFSIPDSELLHNDMEGIQHSLEGLLFKQRDPFLPPPDEDQQLFPVPAELFQAPEIPELDLDEKDFN